MAAPTYETDLTLIDDAASNATYTNIGTGADASETDYFIQGAACVSKPFNITAGGLYHNEGAAITFNAGDHYWLWTYFGCPNRLIAENAGSAVAGGMQALVGSSGTAYRLWNIFGSDNYTYGGWRCFPVDILNVTASQTVGTPSDTRQYFGVYANTDAGIGKGNPLGLDVMRKGRGEHRYYGGETGNYATFAGFEAVNSHIDARWGLCQYEDGSYRIQGLLIFGYGAVVDFRDSNKNLIINNTKKVGSDFNRFEVRQSGSRVDWTNINITSLGTTARGNFECIDNADVNIDTCVFTDMGTFIFQSAATALNATFRRCGQITLGGATLTGCTIDSCRDAVSISAAALSTITKCLFISDGGNHAIDLGTISTSPTMNWDNTLANYAASDGSTGNEAIKVSVNNGQTLTINVVAGASTPSVYNTGAGTVDVSSGQITLTLTGLVTGSDIVILTADTTTERVNVDANSGTTYAFVYTFAASDYVDICVYKAGYVPYVVRDFLLANSNASLPIAQVIDRNYVP